jgi:hypothetical protein
LARGNSRQIEREEIYQIIFFRMKPKLVPEVVNSAQTSGRRKIKKVAALKMEPISHQSALRQGEGGL